MNTQRLVTSTETSPAFVEHESGEGDTTGKPFSGKKFEKEWLMALVQQKNEKRHHTAVTSRVPANTYIVLDSADRFQTSATTQKKAIYQNWNDFILQKPQNISSVFPNRVSVAEICFPWYIPNIFQFINSEIYLYLQGNTTPSASNTASWLIDIGTTAFYTPQEIVESLNSAIDVLTKQNTLSALDYFKFHWNESEQLFYVNSPNPAANKYIAISSKQITWQTTQAQVNLYEYEYNSTPSALKTMGFSFDQTTGLFEAKTSTVILGNSTLCAYTNFVDIVSTKLNYYSEKDANSNIDGAVNNLVCRVYCATETSQPNYDLSGSTYVNIPPPCRPFVIHRQFSNAKHIRWDNEQTVDWVDLKVLDEYGNLVELPEIDIIIYTRDELGLPTNAKTTGNGTYPDFQITLLASEE